MNENNPASKPAAPDPSKITMPQAVPHKVEPVTMPDTAQPKVAVTGQPKDAPKVNS